MSRRIRIIAYTGVFIGLIVGVGYALAAVPNVELVTALIFLAGVLMGWHFGLMIGIIAEFLFSAFNPVGSGLLFPSMLIAQVISMGVVGLCGGLCRQLVLSELLSIWRRLEIGLIGCGLTLLYDLLVSLAYPLTAGFNLQGIIATLVAGLVFSAIHLLVNTLIFLYVVPLTARRIYQANAFFQELN